MDKLEALFSHDLFPLLILVVMVVWVIIKYRRASLSGVFERKLPTSKIGALTVGLVEVHGRIRAEKTCKSPHFNNTCIGYSYFIETETRWNDGDTSYFETFRENKILPFEIYDETGSVCVDVNDLNVIRLRTSHDYERGGDIRHGVSLLVPGDEFFLFARAEARGGRLVLCADQQHDIFNMIPHREVVSDRALAPFYRLVSGYLFIMISMIAAIIYI